MAQHQTKHKKIDYQKNNKMKYTGKTKILSRILMTFQIFNCFFNSIKMEHFSYACIVRTET